MPADPAQFNEFIKAAPSGAERVLQIFSVAESLTDEVAETLYALAPIDGVSSDLFVRALHYSNFVRPRNSEWQISSAVRENLYRELMSDKNMFERANRILYELPE